MQVRLRDRQVLNDDCLRVARRERGEAPTATPHLGHEALQKAALNLVDGLFVNPLVGGKKSGDFEDPVIVAAYEALLRHYYPADRAALAHG